MTYARPTRKSLPRKVKRVSAFKRTVNPVLTRRAKAYSKPAPSTAPGKRKRVSTVTSAKRAKTGSKALKAVVVKNSKAIRSLRQSAWGKYQTHNSVIGGGDSVANYGGGSAFTLHSKTPVLLHLNNLHADPLLGSPHFLCRKQYDTNGNPIPVDESGIIGEFKSLGQFSSHGVLQKSVYDRTTGINATPQATPYPNGEKIKWHGTDLTFEISGYLRNTTLDFWIVQERPQAKPYDPWNNKNTYEQGKARYLPYTLQEFSRVSERMTPHKISTRKYKILGHKRCFVNNMQSAANDSIITTTINDVGGQRHLGSGTGGEVIAPVPFGATTKPKQYVHIKFCPHEGVYPLKKAVGEAEGASTHGSIRPNWYETRSLGTMAWDNFDPKANKFLIITTDHQELIPRPQLTGNNPDGSPIESAAQYQLFLASLIERAPSIKCLRRCWWQDEYTPSAVMGVYPSGGRHLQHIQSTLESEWDTNKARLDTLQTYPYGAYGHAGTHIHNQQATISQAIAAGNIQIGQNWREKNELEEYFYRFPQRNSQGVLPDP